MAEDNVAEFNYNGVFALWDEWRQQHAASRPIG
jgi:hypothetical protein